MKSIIVSVASAFTLALTPVQISAQDDEETIDLVEDGEIEQGDSEAAQMEAVFAQMADMFAVEPLTPEQKERLPQAERIIAKVMPEGSMAEMMDGMLNEFLGPMMELAGSPAKAKLAEHLGLEVTDLELSNADAAELLELIDPAWEEKHKREMDMMPKMMREIMAVMEPPMRKAMSEIYAIEFSAPQLTEIENFFETETGALFARKSYTMSGDPRVLSATMQSMPAMMGPLASIETAMAEATADLPEAKAFADLSAEEKAKFAELTGYAVEDLEYFTDPDAAAMEAEEAIEEAAE